MSRLKIISRIKKIFFSSNGWLVLESFPFIVTWGKRKPYLEGGNDIAFLKEFLETNIMKIDFELLYSSKLPAH